MAAQPGDASGGARIGLLGDGKHDSLDSSQVLVSIVNSARDAAIALPPEGGLLVADECHRYAQSETPLR